MVTSTSKNTPLNVEKTNKPNSNSEELIERIEVKDTPFTVIITEGMIFGVMGIYRVTEKYGIEGIIEEDREEIKEMVIDEVREITWNRIVQVMMLLMEKGMVEQDFKSKKK